MSTTHRFEPTTAWGAIALLALAPTFLTQACDAGAELETRTFELQYLAPEEAAEMVTPYVYPDRPGAPGVVTHFSSGITIRETPEALDRIGEVLERYDRAKPGVRLYFQLIEADGFTGTDERIADVRGALEQLFRFEGYRLLAEGHMAMMEGTSSDQNLLGTGGRAFELGARVNEVRGSGDAGSVGVTVILQPLEGSRRGYINTSLVVPVGETVVLGSSQSQDQRTLILTVRPEFVPLP
ncbi:MAG: hypothetical protein R3266_07280 [Gemmatimonadota bacterium]|nr:hypothetical protein [Gemmatimonadota bacterium]